MSPRGGRPGLQAGRLASDRRVEPRGCRTRAPLLRGARAPSRVRPRKQHPEPSRCGVQTPDCDPQKPGRPRFTTATGNRTARRNTGNTQGPRSCSERLSGYVRSFMCGSATPGTSKNVYLIIWKAERQVDMEVFHPLLHSPNAGHSQGWARPEPGTTCRFPQRECRRPSTRAITCWLPGCPLEGCRAGDKRHLNCCAKRPPRC